MEPLPALGVVHLVQQQIEVVDLEQGLDRVMPGPRASPRDGLEGLGLQQLLRFFW